MNRSATDAAARLLLGRTPLALPRLIRRRRVLPVASRPHPHLRRPTLLRPSAEAAIISPPAVVVRWNSPRGVRLSSSTSSSSSDYSSPKMSRRRRPLPASSAAAVGALQTIARIHPQAAATAMATAFRRGKSTTTTSAFGGTDNVGDDVDGRGVGRDGGAGAGTVGPRTTYRLLGLESFTDREIDEVFDAIVADGAVGTDGRPRCGKEEGGDVGGAFGSDVDGDGEWMDHPRLKSYLLRRIATDLDDVRRHDPALDAAAVRQSMESYASSTALSLLDKFRPVARVRCTDAQGTITDEEDEVLGCPSSSLVVGRDEFRGRLKELASEVDARKALPISLSMLMIGSSVGVTTPVMPFVVENLGLSPGQYGAVVSAFALAKIAGNVPSAVLVERHGRRPYLVYSLCLVSAGVAGIGLSTSFEHLFACRLLTGVGVAALSTAATMTMADISTPLNRASTMAPIMSAFSAGMAFGPAVGGMLADRLGVSETFYAVGASYLGLTVANRILLGETKARPLVFPWHCSAVSSGRGGAAADKSDEERVSMADATGAALAQWSPLLSDARIRNAVLMNGFYWTSLAGSQMTLLPLLLTDPDGLALSATAVGRTYMGMSLVQVVGVPLMARFVDRAGKPLSIVGGCALIAGSMAALPHCGTTPEMACALGTWALGSSVLSTAPVSYVSDCAGEERRAQAVALLRTTGDVGFLIGATGIGMAADWTGDLGTAMHCGAGVLAGATAWFAVRRVILAGREEQEGKRRSKQTKETGVEKD